MLRRGQVLRYYPPKNGGVTAAALKPLWVRNKTCGQGTPSFECSSIVVFLLGCPFFTCLKNGRKKDSFPEGAFLPHRLPSATKAWPSLESFPGRSPFEDIPFSK